MDLVIRSLLEKFQGDHDLTDLKEDEAFEAFAGFCVLSSFYDSGFHPDTFRMGGGNDLSVDVFGILVNGELLRDSADVRAAVEQAKRLDVQIVVIQAKTSPGFEEKVIANFADDLTQIFCTSPIPYAASPDVANIRDCRTVVYADLGKLNGKLPRLHVRYVTTGGQVSDGVERKARQAEKRLAGLDLFDVVDFRCVTRRELQNLHRRATEAVSASFEMVKKVAGPTIAGVQQTLLGLLPAQELVSNVLTDDCGGIRESIFHENVRGFQGYNDVNLKIRDTLRDDSRRQRFAVLNNGITIVTRELTVAGDDIKIRDFQIVNGCQTCHVLFDERDSLTRDVQVSVRLVHTQDKEIIGGIVEATNLQTAVSEQELSAREEFQRELEEFFASQPAERRLYYERRSRQYSSLQDVPKARIVSMSQLTRAYIATFLGNPDGVGRFKVVLEKRKEDLFQDSHHPVAYYTAAAAYYRLELLFRGQRIPSDLSPVKYHILWAMKLREIGPGALPGVSKKANAECSKLLDIIWDPPKLEKLVLELAPALYKAINSERSTGISLSDMSRTKRFAERVRQEVLGARNGRLQLRRTHHLIDGDLGGSRYVRSEGCWLGVAAGRR